MMLPSDKRVVVAVLTGCAVAVSFGALKIQGFASGDSGGCGGDETARPTTSSGQRSLYCDLEEAKRCTQYTGADWNKVDAKAQCPGDAFRVTGSCSASAVAASCTLIGGLGYTAYYYASAQYCHEAQQLCEARGGKWSGANDATCSTTLSQCTPNPCKNGGICGVASGSYTCSCAEGFEGANCEVIKYCDPSPCKNGGTCITGLSSYTCTCALGYQGPTCETNIDDCLPNPCQNGGTCQDGLASYTCQCPPGWSGGTCLTDTNLCDPNPCQHAGSCSLAAGSAKCSCATGFTGATCDTNINDCQSNPCKNGGTCADGIAGYSCQCAQGWTGSTCTTVVPPQICTPNPCKNGGSCAASAGNFACTCTSTHTGATCDIAKTAVPCSTCTDQDADKAYVDCVNPTCAKDCNDSDKYNWVSCATCLDKDKDGYFAGCDQYDDGKRPWDCSDYAPGCTTGCKDIDNDGYCYDADCDKTDASCHAGCKTTYVDVDGDGVGAGTAAQRCPGKMGYADVTGDCAPSDANAWALDADKDGYQSICGNGTDCNDDDSKVWSLDADGDGAQSSCGDSSDCNDFNKSIGPGQWDTKFDGADQNCDGIDGPGFKDDFESGALSPYRWKPSASTNAQVIYAPSVAAYYQGPNLIKPKGPTFVLSIGANGKVLTQSLDLSCNVLWYKFLCTGDVTNSAHPEILVSYYSFAEDKWTQLSGCYTDQSGQWSWADGAIQKQGVGGQIRIQLVAKQGTPTSYVDDFWVECYN